MLESGKFDGIICDFLESFGEVHVEVWRQVWWLISWCDDVIGRLVRDSNIVAWIQYYASCFLNMFSVITYHKLYIHTLMFWRIWLCRRSARGYFNSDTLLFEFRCLPIEHVGSMLTAPAFEKICLKVTTHTVLADIFIYRVHFLPERTLEIHHLLMLKHVIPKVSAASLRVARCTSSISQRCVDWFPWVERRTSIDPGGP